MKPVTVKSTAGISDKLPMERHAQTIARVETWLAETRYFISTLTHEVDGDAGEIIAWLCGEDGGTDPAGIGGSQP